MDVCAALVRLQISLNATLSQLGPLSTAVLLNLKTNYSSGGWGIDYCSVLQKYVAISQTALIKVAEVSRGNTPLELLNG